MDWQFEWDSRRQENNLRNHAIDFVDVCEVFGSGMLVRRDSRSDYGEARWIGLAPLRGRVVVVVFTLRGESIRIISARKANRREQKIYEARANEVEGAGLAEGR